MKSIKIAQGGKKMKKVTSILLMLLMVTALPLALAAEEDGPSERDKQELRIMGSTLGAELRLLQLEKAVRGSVAGGEIVVEAVEAAGEDASELQAILDDLESVLDSVQAVDPSADDVREQFIALKSDAKGYTKDFREIAVELVDPETAEELRAEIAEMHKENLKEADLEIKEKIIEFNLEQLELTYEIIGIEDWSLVYQFANGEVTLKEVKEEIDSAIKALTEEEKQEVFTQFKEQNVMRAINAKEAFERAQQAREGKK